MLPYKSSTIKVFPTSEINSQPHTLHKVARHVAPMDLLGHLQRNLRQLLNSDPLNQRSANATLPPPYSAATQNGNYNDGFLAINYLKDRSCPNYSTLPVPISNLSVAKDRIPWHAELMVYPANMLALMRQGFYWSGDNIDITKSIFASVLPQDEMIRYGFRYMRVYTLESSPNTSSTNTWEAELRVYGFDVKQLRDFQPRDLTHENIRYASAFNRRSQSIYYFDSACEDACYNALLDLTPLPGWWPWPKANQKDTKPDLNLMDR